MKSKAYIGRECDHAMDNIGRLMDQQRSELCAYLDHSHRRMVRWMAIFMTLYVVARLAIWKLL